MKNDELKKINWERYLSDVESSQKELILRDPYMVERLAEKRFKEGFSELIGTNYDPDLKKLIAFILSHLTKKQRFVLKKIYWNSLTEAEVAPLLEITPKAVHQIKKRAQAKVGRLFLSFYDDFKENDESNAA